MPLEPALFRVLQVLGDQAKVRGTAFLVAPQLAVTCAHVVEAAHSGPGQSLVVECFVNGIGYTARVLEAGYSPPSADDVAFLQLGKTPEGMTPVKLGSAEGRGGRGFVASGFPNFDDYAIGHAYGEMRGVSPRFSGGRPVLQLPQDTLTHGFSGCPVLDKDADRVVGMVSLGKTLEHTTLVYAVTAETLAASHPDLRLWPDEPPPSAGGPQTIIHGNVTGPVLSGPVNGPVNIGDIKVGNISGSTGLAIGHGAQVTIHQPTGLMADDVARVFAALTQKVNALPAGTPKEDAQDAVKKLETEARKADQADEGRSRRALETLVEVLPDAWEVAVNTVINPLAGLNTVFQKIAERVKAEKDKRDVP